MGLARQASSLEVERASFEERHVMAAKAYAASRKRGLEHAGAFEEAIRSVHGHKKNKLLNAAIDGARAAEL